MLRLLEAEDGLAWTAHAADQGLELDARHLPPRGLLPVRPLARRRVEGDARRPLARPPGPPRARPARRHGQLGTAEVRAGRGRRLQARPHPRALRPHEHQLRCGSIASRGSTRAGSPCSTASGTGKFFVTTGEVLIPEFGVEKANTDEAVIHARLNWTFPLRVRRAGLGRWENGLSPASRSLGNRCVRKNEAGVTG